MYSLLGHQGIQQVVIQGWIMHEMYLLWFISNLNVAFMLINSSSAYQIQSHCIMKHKIFIFFSVYISVYLIAIYIYNKPIWKFESK